MSRRLVLFGAGNIGRSFIGQLFAAAGYTVVFVDLNERVVSALNERGGYEVVIKHPNGTEEVLAVEGVRAVHAADREAVRAEIVDADIAATAVGVGALPAVATLIRDGLVARVRERPGIPLDVILAENARDAAAIVSGVTGAGGTLGLVQTSIGKMVPIVPEETAARDPLLVFAEPYNTLIVDAHGFHGPIPDVPQIMPVENIRAWVDRKLFMHNLGHAAVAYIGYELASETTIIAQAVRIPEVRSKAAAAMDEAAVALEAEYPDSFSRGDLDDHRDDLLQRFANDSLGDTVYRVGRDLPRKLSRDDRIVGAMLLAARHGLPFAAIARVYRAALGFRALGGDGTPFAGDREVTEKAASSGMEVVLREVSGLDETRENDRSVIAGVLAISKRS